MSALVVCRSRSHGNTARIAHAIADVLGAQVVEPAEIEPQDIAEHSIAGFGSGIYGLSFDPELRRFAASLARVHDKRAFVFATAGFGRVVELPIRPSLARLVESAGYRVIGRFCCPGFDTWLPLRLVGGLNKAALLDFRPYSRCARRAQALDMSGTRLEVLSLDDCLALLRGHSVGRVAVMVNEFPIVLPVNYKLVEKDGPVWLVLRTRPGNVIDRASMPVAFEIDHLDTSEHDGWSVLVRGTLHHVDPDSGDLRERFDPQPWLEDEREAWLMIDPFWITGRRLRSPQPSSAFHLDGNL